MNPTPADRDPDMAGAETAMHRAAGRARERAERAAASTGDTSRVDKGLYSFSQAQGYEELPGPLRLEELPQEARTQIWNLFYSHIDRSTTRDGLDVFDGGPWVEGHWRKILKAKHCDLDHAPLDDWNPAFSKVRRTLRSEIEKRPFNEVFDMVQFVLRHPVCPHEFITQMQRTFVACRLAYTIDIRRPPTILPAATPEEGNALIESLDALRGAGLHASAVHLGDASACINRRDWAGSVRESIHAVESAARQLSPGARTLEPALKALKGRAGLHPALKDAFSKLYGYTSDEQGIRHALLDQPHAQVSQDEAVFMLGACASFAGYLCRKKAAGDS